MNDDVQIKKCPFAAKPCDNVGSYLCTKGCEDHPENFIQEKEVLEQFDQMPWSVYCFTCGGFLDSRGGHPKTHQMATGLGQYKEVLPTYILEKMTRHNEETGDMSW